MSTPAQQVSRIEHDRIVLLEALKLLHEGYEVHARVEGYFDPPDVINGYRPDVIARSADGTFIIVEVKKGDVDWPKLDALERFTSEHPTYELRVISAP